jgi:predicted DNA-binding ribbon-helix-helix protein
MHIGCAVSHVVAPSRLPEARVDVRVVTQGASMKSPVAKRSVVVAGRKTSVSLEEAFWDGLKEISGSRNMTLSGLVGEIDSDRLGRNLSSATRLFVLGYFRSRATAGEVLVREGELADIKSPSRHVAGLS